MYSFFLSNKIDNCKKKFHNNSKHDSNFVAALHMVQKEENQKAVRQNYV